METETVRASVLLVDDTPANLLALRAVLAPLGARLVEAGSGREALELVAREPFAAVLLDVQMPEMDGFEVASRIRAMEACKDVPILFLTAIHRDDTFVRRGYGVGGADYITKPFDADILRARVRAFVDLFGQREAVRRAQVDARTRERDEALRRLVAFERIAAAALDSQDLASFLNELLEIFLSAADAADAASILLLDGDTLKVQARLGLDEEVDERQAVLVGSGFAGTVAATREPLAIEDASSSNLVDSESLRARGTQGLFGVPLLDGDDVIGVAQIGSTRAKEFPESDRRLLSAMAERAAWAVSKQIKRTRVQDVLAGAPAHIAMVRVPSLEYEFANDAYRSLFDGRELHGAHFADAGLGPLALDAIWKACLTGATASVDELAFGTNGTARYLRFTAQPVKNHGGSVDRVVTFAVDVTSLVAAREAMLAHEAERATLLEREQAARAEAELASRAKDEFLATISHELRTPLNAILGWATVARDKAPPDLDNALAIIERNARAQSRMIEDVLDISRIVSGKFRLEMSALDVAVVVRSAAEAVRPLAEAKRIDVELAVEPQSVHGDAERLQQVVWNLLTNAIKFTPDGGKVTVDASRAGGTLTIRVTDTGQGIAPEFLPEVWGAFRQADGSTSRRHGGLGLGLAIVKQIVAAHGGRVTAKSDGVGLGATFAVELPTRAERAAPSAAAKPERSPRLDGLKVLVVDDDDDARALLQQILSLRGADVTTAASADDALAAFGRGAPDVLISDIAMPGGDGYGLIRAVRALPPDRGGRTPGIAVTAYARGEDGERAFAAGFQSHLAKPVDVSRLVSTVANLCGISFAQPAG